MKKNLFKPGFEFIFSALIIAALALPQLLFAQKERKTNKDVRILIRDKDTTYNGKNLKDLSPDQKQEALAEINKIGKNAPEGRIAMNFRVRRRNGSDSLIIDSMHTFSRLAPRVRTLRRRSPEEQSLSRSFEFKMDTPDDDNDRVIFRRRGDVEMFNDEAPGRRLMAFNRRNTQNFNYSHTDKDGISTNVSYHVSDAMGPILKTIAGVNTTDLELSDLTLTPQFSAGKTMMSFSLPAKGLADIQLTDTEGKALWKDKATTSSFNKTFTWGLNGVYYLIVKQNGKTAVKRILKED
ncbi:T9SS type A sorting domain-containing protein [Mucilaginibacter sp. CSA2-8R]|uniref:T9SS type A sorting domain-containing protein n=1 Tax=Mucilaginibacter sp. CSA2-8R TaxID=3141542 RepID=UPI00315D8470